MYALCATGAVNTQGFVWTWFYALAIHTFSFIHESTALHGDVATENTARRALISIFVSNK